MENAQSTELQNIFEGLKLDETIFTPEVMEKVSLVVESQVNAQLKEKEELLEKQNQTEIGEFKDQLIEQLDSYLSYFVDEFIVENKVGIEDTVKLKTADRIIEKFDALVDEFNMSLSEESVDQSEEIAELKEQVSKTVNENIQLKKDAVTSTKDAIISEKAQDIVVDSQRSTFTKLAENFEYTTDAEFGEKLNTLKESIVGEKALEIDGEANADLQENETQENQDNDNADNLNESSDQMKEYLNILRA